VCSVSWWTLRCYIHQCFDAVIWATEGHAAFNKCDSSKVSSSETFKGNLLYLELFRRNRLIKEKSSSNSGIICHLMASCDKWMLWWIFSYVISLVIFRPNLQPSLNTHQRSTLADLPLTGAVAAQPAITKSTDRVAVMMCFIFSDYLTVNMALVTFMHCQVLTLIR